MMLNNILYDRFTTLPDDRGHFHRPRLDKLLSDAVQCPLGTVTAGAGWGKTQAVSAFLRHTDTEFVWLKLSKLDNLTIRFWESFVHAVGNRFPILAARLAISGFPHSAALFHDFLHVFAGEIAHIEKLVLVFDDFHLISSSDVLLFAEELLCAQLKNLSIVLIGRTQPDFDLHGLYTEDIVYQITEENLLFTKSETAAYLKTQGLMLSDDIFERIYAQTEGWIAAIYLISLSLRKNGSETQSALFSAKRKIFALIDQEIFSKYSDQLQKRLIELALFENIPADVIGEYSTDHLNLKDEIQRTNLLIRFNPSTNTYDVHHLFLDFLSEKQDYLTDSELEQAHLKVADWNYNHGSKLTALSHYQKCGCYEKIWDIIHYYEIMVSIDISNQFLKLIEDFPRQFVEKNPLIPVVHANLMLYTGAIAESAREFHSIVNTYEALPPTAENRAVAGEAYLYMGMVSMLSFDYKFVEYYRKADEYLPGGSKLIDKRTCFCKGNYMVLINNSAPGEVQRFVNAIMEAMPHGVRAMNGAGYGIKYVTKAEAAYYMCDMKEAEGCSYKAISQAKHSGQMATIGAAYSLLIRLYTSTGNYAKIAACMEELNIETERLGDDARTEYYIVTRDIMMGWYYTRLGTNEKVPAWILEEEDRGFSPNALGREDFIRAFYLLEAEKYYELSSMLERLEFYYNGHGVLLARLEIQIYKSITAHRMGDISQSMTALRNAYDLAAGNALFMQFIELGKYMRAVIYAAKRSDENTVPDAWLDEIDKKSTTYEKQLNNVRAQYRQATGSKSEVQNELTKREHEILRCICQGLTIREIADGLYISTSSVKKALSNIYDKLGASNKADAVRIAVQLKLFENSSDTMIFS